MTDYVNPMDKKTLQRKFKAFRYYFRDWLPHDLEAPIIDVGCGAGYFLAFLKYLGYRNICGVDISQEQVEFAKEKVPEAIIIKENILNFLSKFTNEYNLITAIDFIEHLKKSEVIDFFELCHSALKSGGQIILQTPNMETPWGTCHRYGDFTHEIGLGPNSLKKIMTLTGFKKIEERECGPIPFGYSLTSTIRYILWQIIRMKLQFYNLIEMGGPGSGVFTRVFLIKGAKE